MCAIKFRYNFIRIIYVYFILKYFTRFSKKRNFEYFFDIIYIYIVYNISCIICDKYRCSHLSQYTYIASCININFFICINLIEVQQRGQMINCATLKSELKKMHSAVFSRNQLRTSKNIENQLRFEGIRICRPLLRMLYQRVVHCRRDILCRFKMHIYEYTWK